jgi:predicted Zn finger-like uncharacterized protein
MIEIQCTSCHTRYRIDERVLPDDTPTFKCSRCGHVFNAESLPAKARPPAARAVETDSQPAQMLRPARSRASVPRPAVEHRDVVREAIAPSLAEQPDFESPPEENERQEPAASASIAEREMESGRELESDHPLDRTFGDREQKAGTGENFRFDFSDEGHDLEDGASEDEIAGPAPDDDRWQVGDAPPEFDSEPDRYVSTTISAVEPAARPVPASTHQVAAALRAARPRAQLAHPPEPAGFELGDRADDDADLPVPGRSHSSGYFLAMFFMVAAVFVGASSLICSEPVASARLFGEAPEIGPYFARPIVPAMLVALHDVHSEYRTLKGGQVALVITGTAQNVGGRALHLVQIDGDLLGSATRPLAQQVVYCGNELSAKMLGEMTPREIEFSQGLSPQKSFAMEPSATAPFLMVFVNPPAGAGNVRLSVSRAVAAEGLEPGARTTARRS